jgi:signal transduction histidine kinase
MEVMLTILGVAGALLLTHGMLVTGLLIQRRARRRSPQRLRCRENELDTCRNRIRDLETRILNAQEDERSRIARELHDDVMQKLALLAIDLGRSSVCEDSLDRLHDIASRVHSLSHRLHPAKLRLIGLVASLRALEREQSRSGMSVVFTHGEVPHALSPPLELCLFRVAQEVVHNAVKYSLGQRISVDLRHDGAGIVLTIADDGVGFEPETVRGNGLGLITIRERVEAAGGTVAIRSTIGRGTRFEVRLPMPIESRASGVRSVAL